MRKVLELTAKETQSIGINNKAKETVYDEMKRFYEQYNLQTLENFVETMQTEQMIKTSFFRDIILFSRLMNYSQVVLILVISNTI